MENFSQIMSDTKTDLSSLEYTRKDKRQQIYTKAYHIQSEKSQR